MEVSLFLRDVWPVLRLKDGGWFVDDDGMPNALRDLNAEVAFARTDSETGGFSEVDFILRDFAVVDRSTCIHIRQFFVKHPVQTTFETDHRL